MTKQSPKLAALVAAVRSAELAMVAAHELAESLTYCAASDHSTVECCAAAGAAELAATRATVAYARAYNALAAHS